MCWSSFGAVVLPQPTENAADGRREQRLGGVRVGGAIELFVEVRDVRGAQALRRNVTSLGDETLRGLKLRVTGAEPEILGAE
jgi:hypothetical protein